VDAVLARAREKTSAEDVLGMELGIPKMELFSSRSINQPATALKRDRPATAPKRNLGCAILLAAIEDYHSLHEETHKHAERFLYPQAPEWQERYDWAVSLAAHFNPQWLRDALDGRRNKWDQQRCVRLEERRRQQRKLKRAGG
jgi:hypothetical protein